jgi:hypothetical protein
VELVLGLADDARWLEQQTPVSVLVHDESLIAVTGQHDPTALIGLYVCAHL